MIFTVFILLLPPLLLLKGLRHWFYVVHIAVMLAISWWKFPSFSYPLWHEYYPYFLTITHLISLNLLTFIAYGWDKRQAKYGLWRVPEKTLHALAFMGGTLGAYIGSRVFRHKTIKGTFRQTFWAVVMIQAILLGAVLWLG